MDTLATQSQQTRGQLPLQLAQEIQALYRQQLGHRCGKVTCQLLENKLTLIIEEFITKPEQVLFEEGSSTLIEQVHRRLDEALRPSLKQLIEQTLAQPVVDLMSDVSLETGRTGIIVILARTPEMRLPQRQR